jgi:hypothetical protein
MRPQRIFHYIPLLAALAACESDLAVQAAVVQWMEWPAEVLVATPFQVRLLVTRPVCYTNFFKPAVSADQSAVTFAPYFLVKRERPVCPPILAVVPLPDIALDTLTTAPALATTVARTFEMRAPANVYAPTPSPQAGQPVRTFGDVTVRLSAPDTSRRNGAGRVFLIVDSLGCARVKPVGSYSPNRTLVLEDQADTTGLNYAFVRGYIHDAAAPVCGQTRVFHLESRN